MKLCNHSPAVESTALILLEAKIGTYQLTRILGLPNLLDSPCQDSIMMGENFAPEEFRSCFNRWCPSAVSRPPPPRPTSKKKEEISDDEAEEEVKERQALQERLEKLCTWSPDTLKGVFVCSPPAMTWTTSFAGFEKLWELDDQRRGQLLGSWLRDATRMAWPLIEALCKQNDELQARIHELERGHLASILQDADIVGCTISGASIRCDLLADVNFPVVLVEEAAEILEPQLLAALPPSCQQLILIGDHFQLRPKIQTFQLGRELNFDRSMIERLFATQEAEYPKAMLKKQNRMRDEFLCLLQPFYPGLLTNHERVKANQPLNICRESMFFVTMREHTEEEAAERRSPINPREAQLILAFAKHIIRHMVLVYLVYNFVDIIFVDRFSSFGGKFVSFNSFKMPSRRLPQHSSTAFLADILFRSSSQSGEGYQPQEISVLAMYDGQVSLLRRLLKSEALEEVQCSSVDRYQGVNNGSTNRQMYMNIYIFVYMNQHG